MTFNRRATYVAAGTLLAIVSAALWVRSSSHRTLDASHIVRFNRDVRPILSDKCSACHGPDANKRQADLRLDLRDSALADREGVRAIVPGDPANSELVRRINSTDPEYRMPPPSSHRSLTSDEINLLGRWIEQGAEYEPHWSYIALQRPELPSVDNVAWVYNSIDRFVLAKLEERGITPSPDADACTLARRLSFDLTGLPPTLEDVDRFAGNPGSAAHEELVDRLLASPHYGERMAMDWLDLVRFADTTGYNEDQHRNIYPYRDYVIRAFNTNLAFDQFTIEQLAGDLLPDPTLWQRIASGYNRLNKVSTEMGGQEKEFVAKYAADRVRTTATAWMGATMGCAECHDHKFDPYTSKDFYSFAAFFADVDEEAVPSLNTISLSPEIAVPDQPNTAAALDGLAAQIAHLRNQRLAAVEQDRARFDTALAEWASSAAPVSKPLLSAPPFHLDDWSLGKVMVSIDKDGHLLLESPPGSDQRAMERVIETGVGDVEFEINVSALHFAEHRSNLLQTLQWGMHETKGVGRLDMIILRSLGDMVSLRAQADDVRVVELGPTEEVSSVRLRVIWRPSTRQWNIAYGLNGAAPATPFTGGPLFNVAHEREPSGVWTESIKVATIGFAEETTSESPPTQDWVGLRAQIGGDLVRRHDPLANPPPDILAIRAIQTSERSARQIETLEHYYMSEAPQFAALSREIAQLEVRQRILEKPLPRTMVTVARKRRPTRMLPRGNWLDESGAVVEPAVPAFLPQPPTNGTTDRLTLARWLVSRDNPMTARALVNRLWKLFFGHGIARTLDDLGSQGTRPSDPDLLDWLASELVDSGWDIKHVVRLIVTSHAYRQSSAERPDLGRIDPENQLFARQSSFRLDAEMVRDNALAVSGLLTRTVGGPSVKPYQPSHYWDRVSRVIPSSPSAAWRTSKGQDQYRRGLYTYWKRTFLHPSLLAFDAPSREGSVAERGRSNTPLQALALLNDPTYVEAARVLAEHAAREGRNTPEAQISWSYRQALSRPPDAASLMVLKTLYDKHLHDYREQPETTVAIAKIGFSAAQWNGNGPQLAALTSVCRVLLNLNETITRY